MLRKYHSDDLLHFYTNHRMQITQERSKYDLMTNSVKFMQQTNSPLSEGDRSVCN